MPLTEVCSARKSPPWRVSLTWMSGWSPSPLVLTAPLIPPWAQTECDRLTGTIESTSTCAPASANLMVVIKPARPPPTTVNRPCAMGMFPSAISSGVAKSQLEEDLQRPGCEGHEQNPREGLHPFLGHPADRQPPGPGKAVQPVGEMENREHRAHHVKREHVVASHP